MIGIELLRPEGLVQSPAFHHVAVIPPGATTILVGGQNAVTSDGTLVGPGDAAAQTEKTMENLRIALEAAGAGVRDLVSVTLLLAEETDLAAAYPVAAKALAGHAPLITAARVSSLAVPGALLEVSAVAAVVR